MALANCRNCGKDYDVEFAEIYLKGSIYFCSAKCVLEYDKAGEESQKQKENRN
jgi:hypothetical protein